MRHSPRFLSILLMTVAWVVTAGQGQSGPGSAGQSSASGGSPSGQSIPINRNSAIAGSAAGETAETAQGQSAEPAAPPAITSQTPATSVGADGLNMQTAPAESNMTERQTVNSGQQRRGGPGSKDAIRAHPGNLPQTRSLLPLLCLIGLGSLVAGIATRMKR